MTARNFPIRISTLEESKDYSSEFQTSDQYRNGWQAVLKRAYSYAELVCLCYGTGSKRLAVRHYAGSDQFSLARFPNTGHQHCPECVFYAPDIDASGLACYQPGVLEELPSGAWKIRLALGLHVRDAVLAKNSDAQRDHKSGVSRPAMSLLGLLHFLWTESRLNTWYPSMQGKRHLALVHHLLCATAQNVRVADLSLNEVLLVATSRSGSAQEEQNNRKAHAALADNKRTIVIAPLAKHSKEREDGNNGLVPISGFHGIPRLVLPAPLWCRTITRFAPQVASWRHGQKIITIMHAEPDSYHGSMRLNVVDLALMTVSDQWIPIDSSHEGVVEAYLRENQRIFSKPLRFDADEDTTFPDFWLLDTGQATAMPMEVFGMNTEAYIRRKEKKFLHYNREYGINKWWYWDAIGHRAGDTLPALPKKRKWTS